MSRLLSAAIQLASVRVLFQTLGLESYSLFALLVGLQGWFLLADFGVGVSTQNYISESRATRGKSDAVANAGRLLTVACLVLTIAVVYVLSPLLGPLLLRTFVQLSDAQKSDLFFLSGSLAIGFGIGNLVYKIWYAEQRGYLANVVPTLASAIGLGALSLVHYLPPETRLSASLVAFVGPTAIIPITILCIQLADARHARFDLSLVMPILRRAAGFWIFAVLAACTLQVDYIVISQFLSANDIATYNLVNKVYGLAFYVYNAMIAALWPVFSELIALKAWGQVKLFLIKYLGMGLSYMVLCTVAMIWLMPVAFRLLAPGKNLAAPMTVVILMGLYQTVRVWTDTFSMLLQSMSKLRPFWLCVPVQAVLSAGLQWYLAPHYGLTGVVAGLTLSFLLTVTWALPTATKRYALSARLPAH